MAGTAWGINLRSGARNLGTAADTGQSRYSRLKSRLRRHLTLMKRVTADTAGRYRWRILGIGAAGLLGVLSQLGAVVLAVRFAALISRGSALTVLGWRVDPRESVGLVIAAGLALGLALLLSAALLYAGRMAACRLSLRYEESCIRRVYQRLAMGRPGPPADQDTLAKLVTLDARLCGRFFLKLLDLPTPLAYLVVTTVILLYIDVTTFLVLAMLLAAFTPLLYRNNARAAQSFREYEEHGPGAALEKKNLLRRLTLLGGGGQGLEGWLDRMFSAGEPRRNLEAYQGFLRSMETGSFLHGLLLSAMMAGLIIFLGVRIVMRGGGWGQLLIFLVALRFFTASLRQLIGISNALSRFSPQVKRFFQFMAGDGLAAAGEAPPPAPPDGVSRLAVLSDLPFSADLARWTLQCLGPPFAGAGVFVVGRGFGCPEGARLGDCLGPGLAHGLEPGRVDQALGAAGLAAQWQANFPQGLDQALTAGEWARAPQGLRTALGLLAAEASGAPWVFLEFAALKALGRESAMALPRLLSLDKLAMIHTPSEADYVGADSEWVVFIKRSGIQAQGDLAWFTSHGAEFLARFSRETGRDTTIESGEQQDLIPDLDAF